MVYHRVDNKRILDEHNVLPFYTVCVTCLMTYDIIENYPVLYTSIDILENACGYISHRPDRQTTKLYRTTDMH